MDKIIIYKEGESLKEMFSALRFSFRRQYSLQFIQDYHQLGHILGEKFSGILYFVTPSLNETERMRLNHLILNHNGLRICLCTDEMFASDAWRLGMFHFLSLPLHEEPVLDSYKKYLHWNLEEGDLTIRNNDGVLNIPVNSILYLQAAGNYTTLMMKGDRTLLQTKQLGAFEYLCEKEVRFNRIHRSLILNMSNIKQVSDNKILFYDSAQPLEISTTLTQKLIKTILGLK